MSSFTVAVVAEGRTDHVVIEAALRAMIPGDLYVQLLQPEPTPGRQQGWCGVFEWCRQYRQVESGNLEDHPLLTARRLDLLVLHLDSDVAERSRLIEKAP